MDSETDCSLLVGLPDRLLRVFHGYVFAGFRGFQTGENYGQGAVALFSRYFWSGSGGDGLYKGPDHSGFGLSAFVVGLHASGLEELLFAVCEAYCDGVVRVDPNPQNAFVP